MFPTNGSAENIIVRKKEGNEIKKNIFRLGA